VRETAATRMSGSLAEQQPTVILTVKVATAVTVLAVTVPEAAARSAAAATMMAAAAAVTTVGTVMAMSSTGDAPSVQFLEMCNSTQYQASSMCARV
jgi:hypothetical protein